MAGKGRDPTNGELAIICNNIDGKVDEIKTMLEPIPERITRLEVRTDTMYRLIFGAGMVLVAGIVDRVVMHL